MENNLPFDKKLIGRFLSVGAENVVYYYNNNKEVIKFPTFFSLRYNWNPEEYCQEINNGFEILKKYLPQHLNQSNLYFYNKNNKASYVIIEPFIAGKALSKKDLKNQSIKNQFLEIIKAKNIIEKNENIFVDLFGSWGLWFWGRWEIPNLLIEKQTQKIYLIDIGTAKINDSRFIIKTLVKFALWIQNRLLNSYLKTINKWTTKT